MTEGRSFVTRATQAEHRNRLIVDVLLEHAHAERRAVEHALLIVDMPFPSFHLGTHRAIENAGRILKESRCQAVKLEGGVVMAATIAKLVQVGIPVMGHIGLTPQSVHSFGGYKIQGKDKRRREAVLRDALAVEEAGAFSVVLEGMPLDLAREITERLAIPTIGIGAGVNCDGQVLVIHDMLGLFDDFRPKFVKRYAELKNVINAAVKNFINEVREEEFPGEEHSFK